MLNLRGEDLVIAVAEPHRAVGLSPRAKPDSSTYREVTMAQENAPSSITFYKISWIHIICILLLTYMMLLFLLFSVLQKFRPAN